MSGNSQQDCGCAWGRTRDLAVTCDVIGRCRAVLRILAPRVILLPIAPPGAAAPSAFGRGGCCLFVPSAAPPADSFCHETQNSKDEVLRLRNSRTARQEAERGRRAPKRNSKFSLDAPAAIVSPDSHGQKCRFRKATLVTRISTFPRKEIRAIPSNPISWEDQPTLLFQSARRVWTAPSCRGACARRDQIPRQLHVCAVMTLHR